jgi:hypothetical protein
VKTSRSTRVASGMLSATNRHREHAKEKTSHYRAHNCTL